MHGLELLLYAILAGCVFAPLEWLLPERDEQQLDRRAVATNVGFASIGALLTHMLLAASMGVALSAVTFVLVSRVTKPPPRENLRIFFDDAPAR